MTEGGEAMGVRGEAIGEGLKERGRWKWQTRKRNLRGSRKWRGLDCRGRSLEQGGGKSGGGKQRRGGVREGEDSRGGRSQERKPLAEAEESGFESSEARNNGKGRSLESVRGGVRKVGGRGLESGRSLAAGRSYSRFPLSHLIHLACTQRPGPAQLSADFRPHRAHRRLWAGPQQLQGGGCYPSRLGGGRGGDPTRLTLPGPLPRRTTT